MGMPIRHAAPVLELRRPTVRQDVTLNKRKSQTELNVLFWRGYGGEENVAATQFPNSFVSIEADGVKNGASTLGFKFLQQFVHVVVQVFRLGQLQDTKKRGCQHKNIFEHFFSNNN